MRVGEPEEDQAVGALPTRELVHDQSGYPLADDGSHDDDKAEPQRRAIGHDADVNQHADANQEPGYEQRVAHELQPSHERTAVRDDAVQDKASEEGAQQPLHPDQFGQPCADEHQREHEHELRHCVLVATQKPATNLWEYKGNGNHIDANAEEELQPEPPSADALPNLYDDC